MFTSIELFGVSVTLDALFWIVTWPAVLVGFVVFVWINERRS